MQWFQLRPTFDLQVNEDRQSVIDKLQAAHARSGVSKKFFLFGECGELHLPSSEHRLWSPHLSFYIADGRDHGLIHGQFAPRLEVWTFIWIVYLAMSFSAFFGLALAYSQWMLGESMWGIFVAAAGFFIIASLYLVAHVGQQWSSDQMRTLKRQLEEILKAANIRCQQEDPSA